MVLQTCVSITMTTHIRAFTRDLTEKWCLGTPQYVNHGQIRKDIRQILRKRDKDIARMLGDGKLMSNDGMMTMSLDIQSILMVVRDEYVWYDGRGLDPRIDEMDLKVRSLIEEFFKRRYKVEKIVNHE